MTERVKNLDRPDETIRLDKIEQQVVELGDFTVGRAVMAPGWRWSVHMRPHVGGDWCQARHVGIVLSGRLGVEFPDGSRMEIGPNEVYDIPPGHDGYTIGDAPCVQIEWAGLHSFIGGRSGAARVLATLLMTDIVDSTATARRLGDGTWRTLLSQHFETVRAQFDRHRGREIKTAGDGFLAVFEGPAPALACAAAISEAAAQSDLSIRAAVHVGEVERVGADIRGIAVHEAARIMSLAGGGDVLVSDLTRTLAAASGFAFEDRGLHTLKGLGAPQRLHALKRS